MAEQSINTHRQRGQRHGTLPRFTQHRVNTQLTHRVNTQHPQSQSTAPTESAEAPSVSTHDMYFYTAHMIYLLWVHCKLARLMPAIGRHSPVHLAGACGTAEGPPRPPVAHIYTENLNLLLKTHTLHASYAHESMADQEPRPDPSRAAIRPRFIECVAYPSSAAAHALFLMCGSVAAYPWCDRIGVERGQGLLRLIQQQTLGTQRRARPANQPARNRAVRVQSTPVDTFTPTGVLSYKPCFPDHFQPGWYSRVRGGYCHDGQVLALHLLLLVVDPHVRPTQPALPRHRPHRLACAVMHWQKGRNTARKKKVVGWRTHSGIT